MLSTVCNDAIGAASLRMMVNDTGGSISNSTYGVVTKVGFRNQLSYHDEYRLLATFAYRVESVVDLVVLTNLRYFISNQNNFNLR